MAGHPADIGGAPVDVAFVIIEHIVMGVGGTEQIAARGVQHALGLSGRAGGVKDKERVFRAHRFGRAVGGDLGRFLVIPAVAARSCIATVPPVRLTTITSVTPGGFSRASSVFFFSGTGLPPRKPSSAVITIC